MEMTSGARKAMREYYRSYRNRNREKINSRQRKWREEHPESVKESNTRYWTNVAKRESARRASWATFGITKERYMELREIARLNEYADLVLAAALKADTKAAGHILLSVTKGIPYDYLEFHERLGRCTLGRTDFYGCRRLFYHYLDVVLKELQRKEESEKREV